MSIAFFSLNPLVIPPALPGDSKSLTFAWVYKRFPVGEILKIQKLKDEMIKSSDIKWKDEKSSENKDSFEELGSTQSVGCKKPNQAYLVIVNQRYRTTITALSGPFFKPLVLPGVTDLS